MRKKRKESSQHQSQKSSLWMKTPSDLQFTSQCLVCICNWMLQLMLSLHLKADVWYHDCVGMCVCHKIPDSRVLLHVKVGLSARAESERQETMGSVGKEKIKQVKNESCHICHTSCFRYTLSSETFKITICYVSLPAQKTNTGVSTHSSITTILLCGNKIL